MIDPRLLRDNPDLLRESQRRRGEAVDLVDRLLELDAARRSAQSAYDQIRGEQKQLSKRIGPLQGALKRNPDDAEARAEVDALMAQAGDLADKVKVADAAASEAARVAEEAWLELSNIVDMRSPVGGEDDFAVLEHVGTPRDFAA